MESRADLSSALAPKPLDVEDATRLEEFKEDCRLRGMSHGSKLSYVSSIRIFLEFLEARGIAIETVDKSVLKSYIDYLLTERLVRFPTLESHFSALSAFYDWLMFEEEMSSNPVPPVRKRYLKRYKGGAGLEQGERKLVSVEEMARLVNSILNARDRAVVLLLAKTGMRRGELITLDLQDIDLEKMSVKLKPTAKRSNRLLFFDEETKKVLEEWLHMRQQYARDDCAALFVTETGGRANKNHIYDIVTEHAARIGLHDPKSARMEDHFTPHCCRHWFTTHLRRRGMPREHIQVLRGDVRPEAMDIYYHVDPEDLRKSYLAYMPSLGIR